MKNQFNDAKRKLEEILNREWNFRGSALKEYRNQLKQKYPEDTDAEIDEILTEANPYFLRKDAPELRIKGTNQIILKLNEYYVGKTKIHEGAETSSHYFLHPTFAYEPILADTLKILNELGFNVPEHNYVGIENKNGSLKVKDEGFGFVIACDLTENGKYKVEDVKEEHFETLSNGAELRRQLINSSKILQEVYDKKNKLYLLKVNSHATKEGPQEAFRHLFFIQIYSNANTGKLVLGDLDHIIFYQMPKKFRD